VSMLDLEIITPEKLLVHEEVDLVEATGVMGEFGILPGHVKLLASVDIGEIRYLKDGRMRCIATSGGFSEVVDDKVVFLVETAEFAEEIDLDRATKAKEREESLLKDLSATDAIAELALHELALKRAMARISAASKRLG